MTAQVDVGLLADVKRYGAADVSACFSCGTCTATCPLVSDDATFPRRMIRYAQLGLRDKLLSSKELWTCYACGECSESCPTQAEPGEFMAAARRYAIAGYDRTGLARTMYTRPVVGTFIAVLLAVFFALFMYAGHGPQGGGSLDLFGFIPEELIHDLGIGVMVVVFLAGLAGVATMARGLARTGGVSVRSLVGGRPALRRSLRAAWTALAVESLGQRRYRADCDTDAPSQPWFRRRWFLHAATMWGFLGLLAATILDYGLAIVGIKATGTPVPIWYPVRLLGTVSGPAAGLRRHDAHRPALPRRGAVGPPLDRRRLDLPGLGLDHRGDRLRHRAGALPADRARVGLLGLPVPRRGGDGARAARAVHEVRPRRLPARGPHLPRSCPGARAAPEGVVDAA